MNTNPGLPCSGGRVEATPAPCRLIVNADDFGLDEAITDGIARAHQTGIVTAASLVTVGRAWSHAIDWCRALPGLDVGLHLTLVGGERPLLQRASSLVDGQGRFPASAGVFLQRYLRGAIRLSDIRAELRAQIERALKAGLSLSHLDSHQHLHALPGIAALVFQLARHYGIAFVRAPAERPARYMLQGAPRPLRLAQMVALGLMCRLSWVAAGPQRLQPPPPAFLGFYFGGRLDGDNLRRMLSRLRPGRVYELMCHPGLTPAEPRLRQWHYRHAMELAALCDPALRRTLAVQGIQLARFTAL